MGANPSVYSSVSGPAKWAAVVVLTAACSAGLTWSVMREPRRAGATEPTVKELPAREAAPPVRPVPREEPLAATPKSELPATSVDPKPQAPEPTREERVEPPPPAPEVVPSEPEPPPAADAAPVARKININKAGQAELELLPRVGPATAKAIIAYRNLHGPFRTVQDLDKVKGIGPKTLERLAPLVTVD